jgi:hypothetical protein
MTKTEREIAALRAELAELKAVAEEARSRAIQQEHRIDQLLFRILDKSLRAGAKSRPRSKGSRRPR